MSQRHSTPKSQQNKSQAKGASQKKGVKNAKNTQKSTQSQSLMNDESIEEFFKVLDEEPPPQIKKGKVVEDDSGIDPTMAANANSITIREPNSLMTSGFQSYLNLAVDDFNEFGTENDEMDFQRLIMESEDVISSQENIITTASKLKVKKSSSNKNNGDDLPVLKKRRLTYEEFEYDIDILRNAPQPLDSNHQQQLNEIENIEVSTFDQYANEPKETQVTEELEVLPQDEIIEPSHAPQNDDLQIVESELVLEDIAKDTLPKKRKPNRKLIVDKVIRYDFATLQKNSEKYMTAIRPTPFKEFESRILMQKTHVDLLFRTPCSTLKNGTEILRNCYERNLKKIPENLTKKRKAKEIEVANDNKENENVNENKENVHVEKRRKTLRTRDKLKDYNETNMANKSLMIEESELLEVPLQPAVDILNDFIEIPPLDEFILPPAIEFSHENEKTQSIIRRQSFEG